MSKNGMHNMEIIWENSLQDFTVISEISQSSLSDIGLLIIYDAQENYYVINSEKNNNTQNFDYEINIKIINCY